MSTFITIQGQLSAKGRVLEFLTTALTEIDNADTDWLKVC
mgnify:CR=1 FL=1